jgi:predicted component of type VI protein secretion system
MRKLRLIPVFGAPIEITKDVLIGRDVSCDVVVADGSISRRHARIEWRGQNWAVVDQASANGTFVDSQRVGEAGLRQGQELRLGGLPFKVEIEGEDVDMGATISTAALADATVMHPGPLPRPPAPPPPPAPPKPDSSTTSPALPRPSAPVAPPVPRPPAAPPRPAPPAAPVTASIPPRPRFSETPPPPPARSGRGPLFWVATGCLGCLGLVVLLAAVIGGGFFYMTRGPVDAVQAHLAEIRQGQLDEAYARLSSEARVEMSPESFARLVGEQPALRDHTEARFGFPEGGVSVTNDRAEVKGSLVTPGGDRQAAVFELVKEAGEWKIVRFHIGDGPGPVGRRMREGPSRSA